MGVWESKGNFLGLNVMVANGISRTAHDIREALSGYRTVDLLRLLGELDGQQSFEKRPPELSSDALAYIARAAIEAGSDERAARAQAQDIQKIALMYHNLEESLRDDEEEALRILIRMGFGQLRHHTPINSIGRTWYIYAALWPKVPKAASVPVADQMQQLIGAPFPKALALGLVHWGGSRKGYTSPYSEDALARLNEKYRCTVDEASRIYEWLSCSYDDIRAKQSKNPTKYQLSPFALTPLVKPDVIPDGASKDVRVIPVPSLLLERLTTGMFHALADANNLGGRTNDFRRAFGYVFESYVGELLRAGCGAACVLPEFRYGSGLDSPDWMVINDDTLLVIEVKASALSLATKLSGELAAAADDLKKNVGKGVEQLLRFQADVLAGATGRSEFTEIRRIQLMLVTQDDIPWANFLYPQIVNNAGKVQFASIEGLEYLQRYCWKRSPFSIIESKAQGTHSRVMDLDRFLDEYFGSPCKKHHPFLDEVSTTFLQDIGVPAREN